MRAAPESFVQTLIAQKLYDSGSLLFLEASVKELIAFSEGDSDPHEQGQISGRIDIATYHKSNRPKFLIEIKKVEGKESFRADHDRIVRLMTAVKSIQNGFLVGYSAAPIKKTVSDRLDRLVGGLKVKMVRKPEIIPVKPAKSAKSQKDWYLGAAVYIIERATTNGEA